jgi:hypothetical protein
MQKPSNYKRRMDELLALRGQAETYRDLFAVDIEPLLRATQKLEKIVSNLLDTREQSVVHRDGSISTQRSPGGSSIDALARALEGHRLRFEKLDEAPIAQAIEQLEGLLKTHGAQYMPAQSGQAHATVAPTKPAKAQPKRVRKQQRKDRVRTLAQEVDRRKQAIHRQPSSITTPEVSLSHG